MRLVRTWGWRGAAAFGCAAALAAVSQAHAEVDRAQVILISSSMVKIEVATPSGFELGSGVITAADQVATNCHVTRRALQIHVLQRGLRHKVREEATDIARDICLLRVEGLDGIPAQLSDAPDLQRGDPLLAIGYTGGQGISFSEGTLVSRHRVGHSTVLRSSTFFASGASGGGLFDSKGRLVGILTFRLRGADDHYFSIPVAWINELARQSRFLPVAPIIGQPFWERSDEAKPAFLRAEELLRAEQWPELAVLARKWLAEDPLDAGASAALGEALDRQGDLPGAEQAMARNVALDPKDAGGLLHLGTVQARMGRRADAQATLLKLSKLNSPQSVPFAAQLATLIASPPAAPSAAPSAAASAQAGDKR